VILVDANILLYATDAGSPHHEGALGWLEDALNGDEEIGFPLVSLLAFVRLSTDPRVFAVPLEAPEATEIVMSWLSVPLGRSVSPTPRHWQTLTDVASASRARGPDITDAHLAALAREHGAAICTTDRGLTRYRVRMIDPTA
jgi:toxin-antitoxin system PIN domain toxin